VHLSLQQNHVHLIVEAADRMALARGMQGFQISAAKHLNRAFANTEGERRKGQVFADRYHATILTSPKQVRHTLAYVLNNWRRHREDRGDVGRAFAVDPFSSAASFDGWNRQIEPMPDAYRPLITWEARSWLLAIGWRRHGLIDPRAVPVGKPAKHRRV
jgi:hypothetical protein